MTLIRIAHESRARLAEVEALLETVAATDPNWNGADFKVEIGDFTGILTAYEIQGAALLRRIQDLLETETPDEEWKRKLSAALLPLEPLMRPVGDLEFDSCGCLLCGRTLEDPDAAVHVEMTTDGELVPVGGDVGDRSQGCFPVGPRCLRRVPLAYRHPGGNGGQ